MNVAFQGELGAFSQQAIVQLLGPRAKPVPRQRFDEVFAALRAGEVDAAALPIENTLAGSVHENYDLLLKYDFEITAETSVRIVHNLIAPPGVKFSAVRKVYSHPVALNQCLDFFARHKRIASVTHYDTAGSVKMVMSERPEGAAAIASELAAKIYGGRILKREIEDDRRNFTRFFLLEPKGAKPREPRRARRRPWKTSLVFSTGNTPGSLFRALSALALRDLNLVKIESRPRRGKPWEYMFYLDLLGHREEPRVKNALGHLAELADFLRVLGSYRAA
ncbi:MAG TPA: prephenate dehydratase [Bryobacteraceae bacterium]|nr:prephenate dehydratase [Bryobacteraceae bacterium]